VVDESQVVQLAQVSPLFWAAVRGPVSCTVEYQRGEYHIAVRGIDSERTLAEHRCGTPLCVHGFVVQYGFKFPL